MSHKLPILKETRPITQKKRKLGEERRKYVEVEVKTLWEVGFIKEVKYNTWLAKVVLVKKSSNQWKMSTNFTDLKKTCPKDAYPLLNINGASGHQVLHFLDTYSGYN